MNMGDIICPRCGEPWEYDYIQHDMTKKERTDFKSGYGCPCCINKKINGKPFAEDALNSLENTDEDPLLYIFSGFVD